MRRTSPPGSFTSQSWAEKTAVESSQASKASLLPSVNQTTGPIAFQVREVSGLSTRVLTSTLKRLALPRLASPMKAGKAMLFPSGDHDGPSPLKSPRCVTSVLCSDPSRFAIMSEVSRRCGLFLKKASFPHSGEKVMLLSMSERIFLSGPPKSGTCQRSPIKEDSYREK